MDTLKKARNLLSTLGLGALVITSTTACTSRDTAAPSAGPSDSTAASASASPGASTVPEAVSAVDPEEPYDPDEMNEWAGVVTASLDDADPVAGVTTHLEPDRSAHMINSFTQVEPGSYSYWFACRGDGDIVVTMQSGGVEVAKLDGTCSGSLEGGDVVTTAPGLELDIDVTAAPVDVVVRITDPLPR